MPFLLVAFLAFMLTSTYLERDVAASLHRGVASRLARWGWTEATSGNNTYLAPRSGPLRWVIRQAWALQDCPFCLSTWIAFFASWYALGEHPWHKSFWLCWLAAVGLCWVVIAVQSAATHYVEGAHGNS